jgi:hypothetical protein
MKDYVRIGGMFFLPVLMFIVAFFALAISMTGCAEDSTPAKVRGALADFEVGKLFDADGCTVYRFRDAGRYHYFATCDGSVMEGQTHSCGKSSCSHDEEVPTRVER